VQQLNSDNTSGEKAREVAASTANKPYKAPSFRFESVFEVSALACGKVSPTEGNCTTNRKVS
jgi:hypothetical protein